MKTTAIEGLFYWGRFQADRGIDFNGFLWVREGGNLLIDPMPLAPEEAELLEAKGGASWILLTNADHWRACGELRTRLGAKVLAPEAERERLGEAAGEVDGWFTDTASLPAELSGLVSVHAIGGGKSAVEVAFFLEPLGALVFGDVVRSHEAGRLRLLPPPKLSDPAQVARDLAPLAALAPKALCLGDGDGIYFRAEEAFGELLASLR